MAKFLIEAEVLRPNGDFQGFWLREIDSNGTKYPVGGVIDPFLDCTGIREEDCFDWDDSIEKLSPEWQKKLLEWAEGMVGKYIICDHLVYKAFATAGNTRFSDN